MTPEAPDVALLSCPDYDREVIESRVSEAFRLMGGPSSVAREGESVFVKVNCVVPLEPGRCATTHPEVVRAVVRQLQEVTDRITIGDSPGGPFNRNVLKRAYERTGMAAVAAETGALLNFDTAEVQVAVQGGSQMKTLVLCKPVVDADRVVSVSKLKTHLFMGLTCAIKNLYGAVPGMQKFTYHSRFHDEKEFARLIVDVVLAADADFHVVDGVWGMEGNGSVWGVPCRLGMIAAGRDPFALDCYIGSLLGLKDGFNQPLAAAVERGLFHGDASRITVAGDDPEILRAKNFRLPTKKSTIAWLPGPMMRRYSSLMLIRPYPAPERCTGCSKCADICPAHAITIVDGTAVIDPKACIRCYCCHELCEHDGIKLERPLFADARRRLSRRRS
jgi:uncharacterized protein (DUF362 family)/NAD-dependent dihydropyrimidine dehydrogenase PreA subunit